VAYCTSARWNRSTRRKPAPIPLCPPHIPYDLSRTRTRASAVGSRRLTAWVMARPLWSSQCLCSSQQAHCSPLAALFMCVCVCVCTDAASLHDRSELNQCWRSNTFALPH
jgi:hypothetical protein